jgi:hypothetical protein
MNNVLHIANMHLFIKGRVKTERRPSGPAIWEVRNSKFLNMLGLHIRTLELLVPFDYPFGNLHERVWYHK